MQTVKVNRDTLLAKVKENRTKHAELFAEAQAGYKVSVVEKLTELLAKVQEAKVPIDDMDFGLHLPVPVDQTEDYDRVIAMLEMSVDSTIDLSMNEFNNYVLDQWNWTKHAMLTNSTYSSRVQR